jgi:hypothetical protein
MSQRYYICGTIESDGEKPRRPEMADELSAFGVEWGSSPEMISYVPQVEGDRHIVIFGSRQAYTWYERLEDGSRILHTVPAMTQDEIHKELAYDPISNPNGYDWFEIDDFGVVTLHAA